jgi:hypothetical protein
VLSEAEPRSYPIVGPARRGEANWRVGMTFAIENISEKQGCLVRCPWLRRWSELTADQSRDFFLIVFL